LPALQSPDERWIIRIKVVSDEFPGNLFAEGLLPLIPTERKG
jgi:hypothetical protein